ncbi:MAG: hypothetical protein ABTQ93_14865 [Candidatus Competibacter denitrificans]
MASYLALVAGRLKLLAATVVSAGVASAGRLVALAATGKLDPTVIPQGSHSALTDLLADDHPQYHTDARGDACYLKLTGGSLSGPLSVSGDIEIGYLANYKKNGSDVIAPLQTGIQQLQTVAGRLVSPIIRDLGAYIDQSLTGSAHTTLAGVAGRIDLTPVCFPKNTPVDRLGVNVVGAASGALGRVVIYSSDVLNGTPTNRVFYGAADLLLGTAGVKEHTASFTFTAGVQYWVGFHHSSIANLSAIPAVALPSLGLSASNATNVYTAIRQTVAYASGAPMTFGFDAATHLTANVPATSVRLRIGPTAMG